MSTKMKMRNNAEEMDGLTGSIRSVIQQSEKYQTYHQLLELLKQQGDLYHQVNRYRQEYFRMQMAQSDSFLDVNERLRAEFEGICNNSLVSDFLLAEAELCKMIRQINNEVLDAAGIDDTFLD